MKVVRTLALAVLVLALVAAALLFTPLGERPLTAVFPVGSQPVPEPETVDVSVSRNSYLVCPAGMCPVPHAESPVFDVPVDRLRAAWDRMLASEPRVSIHTENSAALEYVQRTARFRFPDLVTVRFVPLSDTRSGVIVYSRSVYGISDLGTNRKRVVRWLDKLAAQAGR